MEKKYYSIEVHKSNKLTRVFQLLFGIICIIVALIWIVFNFKNVSSVWSLIVTILFLLAFGYYQIISGLGKGEKFIEFHSDRIRLKRNSVLPAEVIKAMETRKIEIYELSVVFVKEKGRLILRFGTTYTDSIDAVKQEIISFAEDNKIPVEYIREEV
ncbi:MAG: hypothetical protein HPY62_01325 [Bacteroidales bacterium]|nr:hypothetical protein [Bacteroidales bacterium]